MSGDPEQEYFADGMVEDIITALSRFRQLFVIARNSSFTYKGKAVDVKQVGRELGVRYILEGSVRKGGDRLRITGQLVDAITGAHLWADRFDGTVANIFELQDEVTERVIGAVAPAVDQAEITRAKKKPTDSLELYDCFLRGRECLFRFTAEGYSEALRLLYRAIDLDPEFASAYGAAAHCFSIRKGQGWAGGLSPQETVEATRLARQAVTIGRDDALALTWGGYALAYIAHELDAAVASIDRALLLNANLSNAWLNSGWIRIWSGAPEVALEHIARALRMSPLDPALVSMKTATAHAHYFLGHHLEASAWAEQALAEQPRMHAALRIAAASYALCERTTEAQQLKGRILEIDPRFRVSTLREMLGPYRRPEFLEKYAEGLRLAGLPE